jgi:PKD repeat protein
MKKAGVFLSSLLFISFVLTSCQPNEDPPVASFNCDKTSGNVPLTVNFTSTSQGKISSFSWDFGDGGTSTDIDASHTYNNAGSYTVQLTVTGPGGSNSSSKTITASEQPPVASFSCDKTSGNMPLTVTFTSTSSGNITSYSWSFGDGGTSTSQNASHTYNSAGNYTATLTVTGPGGSDSESTTITVSNPGTNVTFYNKSFTTITITLNSITKTISAGSSTTYTAVQGSSVSYYAYTYGTTSEGYQLGYKIEWTYSVSLSGGSQSINLDVSSNWFFLYMTNNSSYSWRYLYVYRTSSLYDYYDIVIPNNGVKYSLGYFASSIYYVKIYSSGQTIQWRWYNNVIISPYGTFVLPGTINQSLNCTGTKSKGMPIDDKSDYLKPSDKPALNVFSGRTIVFENDPNAIDHYSK